MLVTCTPAAAGSVTAVFSALLIISTPATTNGQSQHKDRDLKAGDTGRRIVEFVERAEPAGFQGAVLAAIHGEVVAAAGTGSADLAGKIPITSNTLFEIASATKQFTAAAVMRLVQDGKVRLDESITRYIPGVPESCRTITVRHLLQHTSGVPGTNSVGSGDDLQRVVPSFLRGGPKHPPGTHWEYWNQGYALAAAIITRAAKKDYAAFCKGALFVPAGMTASRFTGDDAPKGFTVAVGGSAFGPPRSALEHPYGSYGYHYRGMGGVVTSAWDLWRWDRALRGTIVLGNDAKAQLFAPGLNQYALGWFVRRDARGHTVQSHGGSVRGFACDLRRYPEDDGCLFVLANRDDAPVAQIATALQAILLGGQPSRLELPRPLGDGLARAIAGQYDDGSGTSLVVEMDGKTTRARIHWSAPRGPVTRAVLGVDGHGDMVLFEWNDKPIKVNLVREGTKPVSQCTIVGRHFRRVE
jgi:CubicO group peptidase (beta-lactamase class C family)